MKKQENYKIEIIKNVDETLSISLASSGAKV